MNNTELIQRLEICVSGLNLVLDGTKNNLNLTLPPAHKKFSTSQSANKLCKSLRNRKLDLIISNKEIPPRFNLADSICKTEIFEILEKPSGEIVFYCSRHKPVRAIEIDEQFKIGNVFGDFSGLRGEPFYPLQYIDIVIFSNWLALYGDVILHSAGIALDGKGYCFIGKSGAGKSTLSGLLALKDGVTVLGEDQVILRYLDNQFWIFGTPWHVKPKNCSPLGMPLEKIFFLERKDRESKISLNPIDGFHRILQNAFIPFYRKNLIGDIIQKVSILSEIIPFYEISFNMNSDVLSFIGNK